MLDLLLYRLEALLYWFRFTRPARDVRIKFVQEGGESMSDRRWEDWINERPSGEFFALMCMAGQEEEEKDD